MFESGIAFLRIPRTAACTIGGFWLGARGLAPALDPARHNAQEEGRPTGEDRLLVDARGESRISADDIAATFIDEAENPKHVRPRIRVTH